MLLLFLRFMSICDRLWSIATIIYIKAFSYLVNIAIFVSSFLFLLCYCRTLFTDQRLFGLFQLFRVHWVNPLEILLFLPFLYLTWRNVQRSVLKVFLILWLRDKLSVITMSSLCRFLFQTTIPKSLFALNFWNWILLLYLSV